jgi:hypothetical protein
MKSFALVFFHPLSVKSVKVCREEDLPAALEQFSIQVNEKVEFKDGFAHQLNNGSLYQIVEIEPS